MMGNGPSAEEEKKQSGEFISKIVMLDDTRILYYHKFMIQQMLISLLQDRAVAEGLLSFINASPSPYHAVETSIQILKKANFKALDETDTSTNWSELPPGNYYFTRNQSSIIAFVKPKNYKQGNGFTIMGAHTDSPVFRAKPITKQSKQGYLMVGVESM